MGDLFAAADMGRDAPRPLADRLRPQTQDDVVGQDQILGKGAPLSRMLQSGRLSSVILWGPPGVGKTTIARLLATQSNLEFEQVSAIFSGVADLRKVFERAEGRRAIGKGTLLFVDEIHRFNKAQQDGFLPHMESGLITLVGATTENPSFELNAALLSRAQVLVLNRLDDDALETLLLKAENTMACTLPLTNDARKRLRVMADGDGRALLNMVEELCSTDDEKLIDAEALEKVIQRRVPLYDKSAEAHYNLASALQKSIRGSDVDAALYWAARMLAGGEDPRFILRRLIVIASEDIGNADPQALSLAIAARDAYEFIGQPEGEIAIGQLVAYLGTAPKSNRSHVAFKKAKARARETGSLPPPPHAVNAPTDMMKDLGYAEGYVYDHDTEHGSAGLSYFPPDMPRETYYEPSRFGFDKEIGKRLSYWRKLREQKD